METVKRKPFQGVFNIVRFNWHFYVLALALLVAAITGRKFLNPPIDQLVLLFAFAALLGMLISLLISWYVYDKSDLYALKFLNTLNISPGAKLVNINAGFDETSAIIRSKYPDASLSVFDFYDPAKHTEVSIERARKAYPPFPGTKTIQSSAIPLDENSADIIFLILAAHEIKDDEERAIFFRQLKNMLKPGGKILVIEHLRDFNNFFAYNFGFFHFHSHPTWLRTFSESGMKIVSETKHTPFLSRFILQK
jgi:SAM-dependent methyltransferase